MRINEVIRERRKALGMTQEQVAVYLGVSTPAVNKWEKAGAYPDITILPALARLLKVDMNTLLSFRQELSEKEIGAFAEGLAAMIQEEGYDAGFEAGMAKIREFPTCDTLIYMTAMALEGALFLFDVQDRTPYENEIERLFERVTDSENAELRNQAVSMLISKYMMRQEYEKAQMLIDGLPNTPFDKKQLQANLYVKRGQLQEASELLERRLIGAANEIQSSLMVLMKIALDEESYEAAEFFADVSGKTAALYELWEYNVYTAHFLLYVAQKDAEKCVSTLKHMLGAMQKKWDLSSTRLYKHIQPKEGEGSGTFLKQIEARLIGELKSDGEYDFLQSNPEFIELTRQYNR